MKIHLLDTNDEKQAGDQVEVNCCDKILTLTPIDVDFNDGRVCGDCLKIHRNLDLPADRTYGVIELPRKFAQIEFDMYIRECFAVFDALGFRSTGRLTDDWDTEMRKWLCSNFNFHNREHFHYIELYINRDTIGSVPQQKPSHWILVSSEPTDHPVCDELKDKLKEVRTALEKIEDGVFNLEYTVWHNTLDKK